MNLGYACINMTLGEHKPKITTNRSMIKKTFKEIGTLEPSKDKIPKENAMSVADGIAQPFNVSELPRFIKT